MYKKLSPSLIFSLFLIFYIPFLSHAFYTFPTKIDTKVERMNIQTVLNTVMVPSPNLKVDGVLGRKSIEVIKSFQESHGLVADGKVGPITRNTLETAQTGNTTYTPTTTNQVCFPGAIYNSLTGQKCNTTETTTTPVTTTPIIKTCSGSTYTSCSITNGKGTQYRYCNNGSWSSYSSCTLTSCNTGYSMNGNTCIVTTSTTPVCTGSTTQSCTITNGQGTQSRTCTNGTWSSYNTCTLTSCNTGYSISDNACVVTPTTPPVTPTISTKIVGVTASTSEGSNHLPEKTLDRNFFSDSRWAAEGDGQYITYELNQIATVSYVRLAFYYSSQRYFDIQYSINGTTFSNTTAYGLASTLNMAEQYQTFSFAPVSAKYIRIVGHGSSDPTLWNAIVETDINGFVIDLATVAPPVCVPESSVTTCSGKCGTQINNCGASVSCTACTAPPVVSSTEINVIGPHEFWTHVNAQNGDYVGYVKFFDMNENVNPTFSIVSGNNGAFQISKIKESSNDSFLSGLITITNKTLLASGSTYNLGVRIYDSATGKNSTTNVIVHVSTNTQTVYFDSSASSGGDGSYGSPYGSPSSIGSWNYLPGKVYLLKRGGSFNSSLDIHNSNINQQNPIVFGAYGQGNRPILDGTSSGDAVGISIGIWNSFDSMSYIYIQNLEIKNWVNNAISNGQKGGHNHIWFTDIYAHDCGDEGGGSWFLWAKNYNDPTNLYITVTDSEVGHSVYAGTKWYAEGMRIYNFSCHDSEGTCMRFVSVDGMIDIPGDKACFGCVFRNNNIGVQMRTSRSQLKYFKIYDSLWNGLDIWFADSTYLNNLSENFLVEDGIISGSRNAGIEIWGRVKDILVKNVNISGASEGAGINILGYEGLTNNITIENSTIKNNSDQGIFISDKNSAGGYSSNVSILNNIISNNTKGGIFADYVKGLTITGNNFSGNAGQSIKSDSSTATGVVISGNIGN